MTPLHFGACSENSVGTVAHSCDFWTRTLRTPPPSGRSLAGSGRSVGRRRRAARPRDALRGARGVRGPGLHGPPPRLAPGGSGPSGPVRGVLGPSFGFFSFFPWPELVFCWYFWLLSFFPGVPPPPPENRRKIGDQAQHKQNKGSPLLGLEFPCLGQLCIFFV